MSLIILFFSCVKLDGQLDGLLFELDNARKDVRYYTHLAEGLAIPTVMGEAVSVASRLEKLTSELGYPVLVGPQALLQSGYTEAHKLGDFLLAGMRTPRTVYALPIEVEEGFEVLERGRLPRLSDSAPSEVIAALTAPPPAARPAAPAARCGLRSGAPRCRCR